MKKKVTCASIFKSSKFYTQGTKRSGVGATPNIQKKTLCTFGALGALDFERNKHRKGGVCNM
jgi:hypothetical protein